MPILTMMKAIRAKCLDCSGGSAQEVALCTCKGCSLWPFRMNKMPKDGTEEAEGRATWPFHSWNPKQGIDHKFGPFPDEQGLPYP